MKHSHLFLMIFTLALSASLSFSQDKFKPVKIFSLSDGTTIKGALVGVREKDGAYVIETATMGTVAVQPQDVIQMKTDNMFSQGPMTNTMATPSGLASDTMQKAQTLMMQDPDIQKSVQELMNDPEIVQMLQDPQLMQAILSMDPAAVQSNPKIQKLLENPLMAELIKKTGTKMMEGNQAPYPAPR
ncbi:MAG: hypothetical protein AB1650_03640 [Candidatus Omnitrophota bacterium]